MTAPSSRPDEIAHRLHEQILCETRAARADGA